MSELKCGRPCPIEHLVMDYDPNGCRLPDGHDGPHLCGNPARHEWPLPEECCASGRCEVCSPGFVWGLDA